MVVKDTALKSDDIFVPTMRPDNHYASPTGIGIATSKVRTNRMEKILRAIGMPIASHNIFTGWTLKQWVAANSEWTERQWYDMISENYDLILASANSEWK